jgi:hypothetical protein
MEQHGLSARSLISQVHGEPCSCLAPERVFVGVRVTYLGACECVCASMCRTNPAKGGERLPEGPCFTGCS